MAAKKKTTKKPAKKAAEKGKIPLEVLEERLKHLTNIVKRRRAAR